jgi:hypothetical protein
VLDDPRHAAAPPPHARRVEEVMMRALVDRSLRMRLLVATLLVTLIALTMEGLAPPGAARAADCDRAELDRANDAFIIADFVTALEIVDVMIASCPLTGELARDSYILEARCQLGLADRDAATEAFCRASRLDPLWSPDPFLFTTDEIEAFREAQSAACEMPTRIQPPGPGAAPAGESDRATEASRERERETGEAADGGAGIRTFLWAAIGGAAALLLVAVLAGGGGDDGNDGGGDLPGFPPPPGN